MIPGSLVDSFGRQMRDLRVSVTDRCNFRCLYCLPETEEAANFYRHQAEAPRPSAIAAPTMLRQWLPRASILTFEEIARLVRVAISMGIQKIRLTGGEPLLRRDFEKLAAAIAAIPGLADLAMTTNGFLFAPKARALRAAGIRRVNFSLDSLDRDNFRRITGRDGLKDALEGIEAARREGFASIKINAVIIRGLNEGELEALADYAFERGLRLRFIEFMPLDSQRAWQKEMVVSHREMLDRLSRRFTLVPIPSDTPSETARRYAVSGGRGEIGIIASVTEPFCHHCNRIRLTADGHLRTCLFSHEEHDLKRWLRGGASDDDIRAELARLVHGKEARHHIGETDFQPPERSMSCIGG